jgi:ribonucleoside-diphosphate reductase alpha chain
MEESKSFDEKAFKWLNENQLSYDIWNNKYRNGNESFENWVCRVSGANDKIADLIVKHKFLFGGRTLANRGIENSGSYSNCYSIGYVPDSLEGIMDVASKIALTFKAQGGQGLSLSKIRPKGSLIKNKYPSDGIVPFMHIFNTVTESISQGGSRKGALLMSIDATHPEALTFIKIKENPNEITKANLSVECSNDFMWRTDLDSNYTEIFNAICESAWKSAEPGLIFTDRFRNYNLMEYVNDYQIETCNPCGR